MVAPAAGFTAFPLLDDGASSLIHEVFATRDRDHARVRRAVGALPFTSGGDRGGIGIGVIFALLEQPFPRLRLPDDSRQAPKSMSPYDRVADALAGVVTSDRFHSTAGRDLAFAYRMLCVPVADITFTLRASKSLSIHGGRSQDASAAHPMIPISQGLDDLREIALAESRYVLTMVEWVAVGRIYQVDGPLGQRYCGSNGTRRFSRMARPPGGGSCRHDVTTERTACTSGDSRWSTAPP